MLHVGMGKFPKKAEETKRFEIPKVKGMMEGNKTIITNFLQMCDTFNRSKELLLKYLQKELATPAILDGERLILGSKVNSALLNQKVEQFAREFVLCHECGKPDTEIVKQEKFSFLKCQACGSKKPAKILK